MGPQLFWRARLIAALALACLACAPNAAPTWTPAAAQGPALIWSLVGTSDEGGAAFNRPSDRRLGPGTVLARASCDVESVLHIALVNGSLARVDQPVPLRPSGKLVCSPWSAGFTVHLDGEATGYEDRLLVSTRAGATGREPVTYSIDILQPREN